MGEIRPSSSLEDHLETITLLKRQKGIARVRDILNIPPETAEEDACNIEHCVSRQTLAKFSKFLEFVKTCSKSDKPEYLQMFDRFVETGIRSGRTGN